MPTRDALDEIIRSAAQRPIGQQVPGPSHARPRPAAPAGRGRRTQVLADAFDPRRNAMGDLRLALAGLVALMHGLAIGFGYQWGLRTTALGDVAVDAFFVLSGFLVVRSYLRLDSLPRFVWHRALRIMPAFWTCLVVTALVAAPLFAVLGGRPASSVFSGPENAVTYVARNALLQVRQYGISGLPDWQYEPDIMNGSLWTLFYEALCYGIVAVLGAAGVLRRRPVLVAAGTAVLWIVVVLQDLGLPLIAQEFLPRFALLFLLGALGHLYADRLPIDWRLALGAAALVVALALLRDDYRPIGSAGLAYVCLWAVVRLPVRRSGRDLSYGVYLWHWPVLHLLALMGLSEAGELIFLPLGVCLATLAAWASWHLVEEPALRWKDVHWGASRDRRVGADATRSRRGASKGRHAASPTTG